MGNLVRKFVTEDTFDETATLVRAGHIGTFDEDKLSGKEKHLTDVEDFQPAIVQIAPIGPTGPNPRLPQQIPPDAIQGPTGTYQQPGKVLVAEVTKPGEERAADAGTDNPGHEAEVTTKLSDVMDTGGAGTTMGNADDALVEGTVADVTADLGGKTDEQLQAMRAAEIDREKPRKGVITAIDAELEGRASA